MNVIGIDPGKHGGIIIINDDYEIKRSYANLMYSMGIDLALVYERMENKDGGTAN